MNVPGLADRLWSKVLRGEPDACWIWTAAVGEKGHPVMSIGALGSRSARRMVWALEHGEVPKRRMVTTTCGQKRCLNPAHLALRAVEDDVPRFWSHVKKLDGDGCWEWTSTLFNDGYASFKMQGKQRRSCRVAWELANGPIPDGLFTCHRCDNKLCVRPDHLFLGTALDNTRDMIAKGRNSRGEKHGIRVRQARAQRTTHAKDTDR